jgi:hypothetical protein
LRALLVPLSAHEAALSDDMYHATTACSLVWVDPIWPKALPNKWLVGAVANVAVDRDDHVWISHRQRTLQPNETRAGWPGAPRCWNSMRPAISSARGAAPAKDTSGRISNMENLCRCPGQCLDSWRRAEGRAVLKFTRHWGAYGRRPDDGYFETMGEKLPGRFKGVVQSENKPSMIPMRRRSLSFASLTR